MEHTNDPIKDISEIRSMMERSTKTLSLSGLAGVTIGILALCGALYVPYILEHVPAGEVAKYVIADALAVLLMAIALSIFFSSRMAKKKRLVLWNHTTRYLVTELSIPLFAGGVFCVAMLVHRDVAFLPAAMLAFYGLSLVNASKFTISEVRYLGLTQAGLGLTAALIPEHGLLLWALGFGVVHIAYGVWIWWKYER
jgi:hypothetical protein